MAAERLELADCIRLACAEPSPVARMGLEYLKQKAITSPEQRAAIAALSTARCAAVAGQIAAWAIGILGLRGVYERELMLRFFDALLPPTRRAAWEWLVSEGSPGYDDAVLFSRLIETPYDDVRLPLIDELQRRVSLPGGSAVDLTRVWCSVLLGVHRGGRQKLKAVGQLARAIGDDPIRAGTLLPILRVAVRSVRPAEARAGLAAVVAAAEARPEIVPLIEQQLPELKLTSTT